MVEHIYIARARGFCAGVRRAVKSVEEALRLHGKPVYVRHAIVHNEHVISRLQKLGAIFVEDLSGVPDGACLLLSAHGSPRDLAEQAKKRFRVIDATCPLVVKVHMEAEQLHSRGYKILLIGHKGHQEVVGTMGYAPVTLLENISDIEKLALTPSEKIAVITQTTLSIDETKTFLSALRARYPDIHMGQTGNICFATQNRQNAVKTLAQVCDLILVIGSNMSSNSQSLVLAAKTEGKNSELVSDVTKIPDALIRAKNIGVTAGASVPEDLIQDFISRIRNLYPDVPVTEVGEAEAEHNFPLPI